MSSSTSGRRHDLVLDKFALRQFNNPTYTGTQIHYNEAEFEKKVNEYHSNGYPLVDGYMLPSGKILRSIFLLTVTDKYFYCSKHLFIPNFAEITCGYIQITPSNRDLIESCYEARKEKELPVLIQYFDSAKVEAPIATYLDIILYSREQIIHENIAMGEKPPNTNAPWGIISVKGQLTDYELPMQPITMMRNALGKEFGGSGVPIDPVKYMESVKFWSEYVAIK